MISQTVKTVRVNPAKCAPFKLGAAGSVNHTFFSKALMSFLRDLASRISICVARQSAVSQHDSVAMLASPDLRPFIYCPCCFVHACKYKMTAQQHLRALLAAAALQQWLIGMTTTTHAHGPAAHTTLFLAAAMLLASAAAQLR